MRFENASTPVKVLARVVIASHPIIPELFIVAGWRMAPESPDTTGYRRDDLAVSSPGHGLRPTAEEQAVLVCHALRCG